MGAGRRLGQAVEHPAFTEQWSLRGIQVFGLDIVQPPAAEGDDTPPPVADGEHDPSPEAVVGVALVGLDEEAGRDQDPGLHALVGQRRLEFVTGIDGEAEAEVGDGGVVQAAAV